MVERQTLSPALTAEAPLTVDQLQTHLQQWRADTAASRSTLQVLRQRVEEVTRQLENPRAAFEYIDFFSDMFDRITTDLDAVVASLPDQFSPDHADTLRQIASNGAVEQRRTVVFRDKWVNKPLPYEQVRPLLTQLASDVRDQLGDYKELTLAATQLMQLFFPPKPAEPPPPAAPTPEDRAFDRRALFTKLIKPLGEDEKT
jgi:hypothetical protein